MKGSASEDHPLVSIVIPVFNGSNYLRQAIDSALAQTYPHCEVLVVNDGSNDDGQTERIALNYGDRLRYLSKPNGGVASALNLGIAEMSGSLFSWLSHDDLYDPLKIERQVSLMLTSSDPDVILYSDYRIFSDDGQSCDVRLQETAPGGFRYRLARRSNVNGCTLLIPIQLLREVGGFNESLRATQDYDLWFRLAKSRSFIHVPEVLVASRIHPQQGVFAYSDLAQRECQNLHALFAHDLLDGEIPVFSGHGLHHAFTDLAQSFWARGFDQAAMIAECRAAANGAGPLSRYCARLIGTMHHRLIGWVRRWINPRVRARLRQSLRLKANRQFP